MSEKAEAMASADVAWLRMDHPTNLMMITAVMTFDDPLGVDQLKALVTERLLAYNRFRQRVVDREGSPRWVEDRYFDLDRHIHRLALPAPGDQGELQQLVSDLMSTPLDFTKPLWQMHLVENYGGGSALITRLHHCIGDGIALVHVLLSITDEHFDPARLPKRRQAEDASGLTGLVRPVVRAVGSTLKTTGSVLQGGLELILSPSQLLYTTMQGMSLGAALGKLVALGADSDTVFKGELGVSKQAAWSKPMPLKTVKRLGRAVDAKINDVLLTAVAGGLRRYLQAEGQPVEDVEIRALVPVNLRPMEEAFKLGNRFGLVFLALPVGIEDPRERLLELKRRMDQLKNSSEAVVAFGILQAIGAAPKVAHQQVVKLFSKKGTAVMTNVPGPRQRLHLVGNTLRQIMFWVPRAGGLSMGVSILSYAGEVLVGVATDTTRVESPEALIEGFHEEMRHLKRAFGVH